MKLCRLIPLLVMVVSAPWLPAQEKSGDEKSHPAAATEAKLPEGVLNFYGRITGTVESVDGGKGEMKVKVGTAVPDAAKNKATKPEALVGMVITVTPLEKKDAAGKKALDATSVAYIKGAHAGDAVALAVRASSKGVVFRLLKVPAAAEK